jgi:hypothetical protein
MTIPATRRAKGPVSREYLGMDGPSARFEGSSNRPATGTDGRTLVSGLSLKWVKIPLVLIAYAARQQA